MRHGNKINHLGRKYGHRAALLKNLSISLIMHKRIETTLAKAKALRGHIEPLVTRAKDNTTHSRRIVFSHLQNKEAIKELFDTVAEKVGDRPGGYVRIVRVGYRQGDNAEMAIIEFVDFNDLRNSAEEDAKKGSRRRRKKSSGTTSVETKVETATEEAASEEA